MSSLQQQLNPVKFNMIAKIHSFVRVLRIEIDYDTEELEALIAVITVVKGNCEH